MAKNDTDEQQYIRSLAELICETDLAEVEIEKQDLKIRLVRNHPNNLANVSSPQVITHSIPTTNAPSPKPETEGDESETQNTSSGEEVQTSPMVGTVFLAPEPGARTFIEKGSKVKKDDTILIIEAMKTMNQIPAERAGTITAVHVEDAQPIEFGEPLVTIE